MKKALAILLSILLLMACVPVGVIPVLAATFGTTGDCTWTLDGTHLTISGDGEMDDYDDDYIDGAYRTTAPWGWRITSVTIEDGVTTVGAEAFYNCELLRDVHLPSSLKSLGYDAFYNCDALTKINIPKSLEEACWDDLYTPTRIFYTPFNNCDGLKTVEFEEGITSIIDHLFWQCTGLEEIEIPDTVTTIGQNAFNTCSNLKKVTIPDTVTEIGDGAFSNCVLLQDVNLPSSLKYLGPDAFYNCDALAKINIPKSLEEAGWSDFYTPAHIFYTPFNDCDGLKTVEFEEGITSIIDHLFWQCTGLEEIEIPDTVTTIGQNAFNTCSNLKKVTIPDTVTEIGDGAFSNCVLLQEINLPSSLKYLGPDAFYNCDALTKINIPKSLEEAGWSGDYTPASVDYTPFNDCDGLKTVEFEEGITSIIDHLFWQCTGLEEIEIPDTVTTIGYDAFRDCSNLKKVTIPDAVTEIASEAFYNCVLLQEVILPSSLDFLGDKAFYHCTSLTSVTIGNRDTTIGDGAFDDCSSLADVYYVGTEDDRGDMDMGSHNEPLIDATWHYNSALVCDHVYDNANDTTCNECGAARQIAAQVLTYAGSSISEDVNGLAFRFDANVFGVQVQNGNEYVTDSATVTPYVGGESYKLVCMGAILSNSGDATLDMEHADGKRVANIEAVRLCDWSTDSASFAVRLINIPENGKDIAIFARPYYVYEVDGEEIVVYGDVVSKTYNEAAK